MLGQVVRQQHVNGAARGRRDLMRSWRIVRRAFVWPAHADDVVLLESQREVVRPLGRRIRVAVEKSHDVTRGRAQAFVSRRPEAGVVDG